MSVAAIMLVRDEEDVIEYTLRHLVTQVDQILVADNLSTDGTVEILADLLNEGLPLHVRTDEEPGYYQASKTTALAFEAQQLGHSWVVPCDADELWYSPDGRRVGDFLDGVGPDVKTARALVWNHFPTGADPHRETNPFLRIGYRHDQHQPAQFGKVAVRVLPGLKIQQGNHSAWSPAPGNEIGGLEIRHFSWRTEAQYVRKIRNGEAAYAATDLPESAGAHWRMFEGKPDEAIVDQYRTWFSFKTPADSPQPLVYDPAPWRAS